MKNNARFIAPNATVLGDLLTVGEGTWIGFNCLIDAQVGRLGIGRWCDISSGAHIYTHSTHLRCAELGEKVVGPVTLEDHVFIGANSVVLPNTKIGHHSIVGALSVVQGEFPPYSLIVGAPARVKRVLARRGQPASPRRTLAARPSKSRTAAGSGSTRRGPGRS